LNVYEQACYRGTHAQEGDASAHAMMPTKAPHAAPIRSIRFGTCGVRGVTPYAAVQAKVFDLPGYAEHALWGPDAFALRVAYAW
jgi:hypothetical protein